MRSEKKRPVDFAIGLLFVLALFFCAVANSANSAYAAFDFFKQEGSCTASGTPNDPINPCDCSLGCISYSSTDGVKWTAGNDNKCDIRTIVGIGGIPECDCTCGVFIEPEDP